MPVSGADSFASGTLTEAPERSLKSFEKKLQKKSKFLPSAAMPLETKPLYEFGGFRLDPGQHLLLHQGEPVLLAPKAFELLVVLIQSDGRLQTKDDLMRQLWPNSFVEEANLTVNISALRKALGDSLDGQEFIETVPKHGYRFIAPVTEVPEESKPVRQAKVHPIRSPMGGSASADAIPAEQLALDHAAPSRSRTRLLGVLALVVGIALAGAFYSLYRERSGRRQALESPRRLAILPFQNLRQDPNSDFLGYSLADAVITKLGYVQALRVRPSYAVAKYRNQVIDIRRAAAELNVDTLLMGNFIRDGDDLRITCQLVDASGQNILWRRAFDLKYDRLLTVHDNVAQEIVRELEPNLSAAEAEKLKPDQPMEPLAYEYYLRGVDLYSRSQFPTAVKMLEKSAELDPNHALTWAYLGRSYNANASFEFGGREDYSKAQGAFERALSLQPTQIEANVYMANWFTDTGRVEQAVPLLRKALETNPDHAEVHWELGYAYRFAGMLKESVAECERARELDPGVKISSSALNTYLYLGDYEKFLASLPASSEAAFIFFYRGFGEYHEKKWDLATRDFDRAYEIDPSLLQARVGKALSHGLANQSAKGLQILHDAEGRIRERGVGDSEAIYKIAQAYAVLGDHVSALRVLRNSIENGFFASPYFMTDPLLDSLRSNLEFSALMKVAEQRHLEFQKKFF
jgi:DNA-binding winged helix-turn-helix (wHTH) protein/TolB-like protein